MVQVEEIVDQESFQAWLEALPEDRRYEVAIILATRCALRVFPLGVTAISKGWVRSNDFTTLPTLRCLVVSGVATRMRTLKIKSAAVQAHFSRTRTSASAHDIDTNPRTIAANALNVVSATITAATATTATRAAPIAGRAVASTASISAVTFSTDMWSVLRDDINAMDERGGLLAQPLWPEEFSDKIWTAWTTGRDWMQANPGYRFWIDWYEAIVDGRPLTRDWDSHWQLMQDIALIAPEDWDMGAEHVAGVIDLITQKHALQRDVAQIKRALENEIFNVETLGQHRDNLPDDLPPSRVVHYRAQLREVLEELEAVEAALEPPVPDAEVLEEATGRLRAAWGRFKAICAAIGIATASGGLIYLTGAIDQAGARSMDWIIDEGAPALIQSLRSVSPKPSPATQAPRHARGERGPDKR